jgi:hypothetical protein
MNKEIEIVVVSKRTHSSNQPHDIYIGRPSILGNPFSIGKHGDRETVIQAYEKWILYQIDNNNFPVIGELKRLALIAKKYGKLNLICWCAPLKCHGDVIRWILYSRFLNHIKEE